jgi:hypothetical protein
MRYIPLISSIFCLLSINAGAQMPSVRGAPARQASAAAMPDSGTGTVGWTRFVDPHEHAFAMDVPAGWNVLGGMLRHTAVDPGFYMRVLSPDRRTYLMIGDPDVTVFATPIVSIYGQRQPEHGAVLNYLPGPAFARAYLARAIPALCGAVNITGQRERPDLANGPWARFNPQARHDGGEVTFTCIHGNTQARGIIAASTYILNLPGASGGVLWSVDFLAGIIAPPEEYAAAETRLTHMVASTRLDPEWARAQQAMTQRAAHEIDVSTQNLIAASERNMAAARARQNQFDQQFEAFDRIITGTSPYADSAGNVYQMDNTQLYHWAGPGGRTTTTNGPAAPGLGWQPLHEVPPQ